MLGSSRTWWGLCLLLVVSPWLMGLGGGTESTGAGPTIPIPQESFTVTVTDRTGQSLEARRFTWEGKVYLRGQVGNATVSLPFGKLQSLTAVQVAAAEAGDFVRARVTLRGGESVDVTVDRTSKCYGETRFGTYEIFFKDIASIRFE
jgi:hypothetical protein